MTTDTVLPELVGTLANLPKHTQETILAYGAACARTALQSAEVQRRNEWRNDLPPEEFDRSPILAFNRRSREVEIVWGQLIHEVSDYSQWMLLPPPPND